MNSPAGGTPPLRIGHREREAACAALEAHLEAGRLDAEEYGERYAKAAMARTREELHVLFVDLPAPHAFASTPTALDAPGSPGPPRWHRYVPVSAAGRIAAAVVLVVALIALIPLAVGAAVVWFVVLPRVAGRGFRGYRRYHRWHGPAWR